MKTLGYVVLFAVLVALAIGGYMAFKKGQEQPTDVQEEVIAPEDQGAEPEGVPTEGGETGGTEDTEGTEGTGTEGGN